MWNECSPVAGKTGAGPLGRTMLSVVRRGRVLVCAVLGRGEAVVEFVVAGRRGMRSLQEAAPGLDGLS